MDPYYIKFNGLPLWICRIWNLSPSEWRCACHGRFLKLITGPAALGRAQHASVLRLRPVERGGQKNAAHAVPFLAKPLASARQRPENQKETRPAIRRSERWRSKVVGSLRRLGGGEKRLSRNYKSPTSQSDVASQSSDFPVTATWPLLFAPRAQQGEGAARLRAAPARARRGRLSIFD